MVPLTGSQKVVETPSLSSVFAWRVASEEPAVERRGALRGVGVSERPRACREELTAYAAEARASRSVASRLGLDVGRRAARRSPSLGGRLRLLSAASGSVRIWPRSPSAALPADFHAHRAAAAPLDECGGRPGGLCRGIAGVYEPGLKGISYKPSLCTYSPTTCRPRGCRGG